jgi:hypothetical protein
MLSLARHYGYLEVFVELDVVLPSLHLTSSTSKEPLASVSFSIFSPVQPKASKAASIFSASAGVTGVSASAEVLPTAANTIKKSFICASSSADETSLGQVCSTRKS